MRLQSHRPLRRLGTVTALVAMLAPLLAGLSRPVAADQISDKRAEAARLAQQLNAQGDKISMIAERVDNARIKAQKVNADAAAARAALAQVDQKVQDARSALTSQAVSAYVHGGRVSGLQALASGDGSELGVRSAYVKTITGRERSALDALHAAREELTAKRQALDAAQKQANAALAAVQQQQAAAAAAEADQQRLLSQVKGELASLVADEEQRQAAATAARVQQDLAARSGAAPASRGRAAPSGPEPPVSHDAAGAVEEARRQLGKPYEWGAAGPNSFDCSGLTMWSWGHAGHSLPHSAAAQYNSTTRIPISALQPGDLVFFGSDIHHMGIYVGGGQMIEAPHSGAVVRYASIYRSDLMGAGRVG